MLDFFRQTQHQVGLQGQALLGAQTAHAAVFALQFGYLLGGSIIIEVVFSIPGMGRLLIGAISTVTLGALAIMYRPLVLECVDPVFLGSVSRAGGVVHLAFLVIVVANLVGGFQALGTLLAVGLMMLPAAAARFWARDVTGMIAVATGIGVVSGAAGLLLSYHWELPAGPAIILVAGGAYLASLLVGPERGLLRLAFPGRHLEA